MPRASWPPRRAAARAPRASPPAPGPTRPRSSGDFQRAWEAKDIAALVRLLDPEVTAVADGGGRVTARLLPIRGGEQVAQALVSVAELAEGLTLLERTVNGRPGLVAQRDGVTGTVIAFDVAGDRITHVWAVRNPEKLRLWTLR